MIFSPVGSTFSSFFLDIVLFECHLLDEKWRVARDRANFVASRTYSVLLVTETETQNGKHRLKAFIDLEILDLPLLRYMYLIDTRLLFHGLLLEVILCFLRNMFLYFLHAKLHKFIDYITTCRGIPCLEGLPRPCIVSHIC